MFRKFTRMLILPLFSLANIASAELTDGKFSGYVFGDYYAFSSHHDKTIEGKSGYWFRRAYFTYDYDHDETFSSRLRWEVNTPDNLKGTANTKMEPAIKDAYLKAKLSAHSIYFGLSPTPTWNVVEKYWGYRAVEKTPMDLFKLGSSRDTGISFRGSFDSDKKFGYHLKGGQGNSNKPETNKSKKGYLSLYAKPVKGAVLEVYGDIEDNKGGSAHTDYYTVQGFAYYGTDAGRAGFQFVQQIRKQGIGVKDQRLEIASAFGVLRLMDKLSTYLRLDYMMDPNPSAGSIAYIPMDANNKTIFGLIGLDYEAGEKVHIMPNVETVTYRTVTAGAVKPDSIVIPRVTLYYKF